MGFSGKFGVLIGPDSVIQDTRRDCSLGLSTPSPNRRATSSRIYSPSSTCVKGAVSAARMVRNVMLSNSPSGCMRV
eukprot:scaffold28606_cov118-Isochrysis_galbana.AAC.4